MISVRFKFTAPQAYDQDQDQDQFSDLFSPESLTKQYLSSKPPTNDSSSSYNVPRHHHNHHHHHSSACIPFFNLQEDEIYSSSSSSQDPALPSASTPDEIFWTRATTRRPAPGTEVVGRRIVGAAVVSVAESRREDAVRRLRGILAHLKG